MNGFQISSDKCAFTCKKCVAIYTSKGLYGHSFFPTSDPKCKAEVHHLYEQIDVLTSEYIIEKICICPDLDERSRLEDEELHKNWWEANAEKNLKCHICKCDYPEGLSGWKGIANGWKNYRWTGESKYEEKLVCEDCYHTSQEYKNKCPPKARRRYLIAKGMMKIDYGYHDLYHVDRNDVAEYMISNNILSEENARDFTPEDERKLARVLEDDWNILDDYSKLMYHVIRQTKGFPNWRASQPPTKKFIRWLTGFLKKDPRSIKLM